MGFYLNVRSFVKIFRTLQHSRSVNFVFVYNETKHTILFGIRIQIYYIQAHV